MPVADTTPEWGRPAISLLATSRAPGRLDRLGSFEQLSRLQLNSFGQLEERRDLRVAFASLDTADLGGVDAAALSDLLLSQAKPLAGFPQIGPEVAHRSDRLPWEPLAP